MNLFQTIFNTIGELLYPSCCCHCGKTGPPVCSNCYEEVEFLFLPVKPDVQPCYLDSLTAACRYTGVIKSVIKQMKFHSVKAAGVWCGQMLYYTTSLSSYAIIHHAELIDRHPVPTQSGSGSSNQIVPTSQLSYPNHQSSSNNHHPVLITSVPLHPKRQHVRGFNQAEEIAKAYASLSNFPYHSLLKRTIYSAPQAQLHAKSDREHHLTDHFVCVADHSEQTSDEDVTLNLFQGPIGNIDNTIVGSAPEPSSVILIDDVVTTGSTLNECARVLKSAGYTHVHGLTVAHGL